MILTSLLTGISNIIKQLPNRYVVAAFLTTAVIIFSSTQTAKDLLVDEIKAQEGGIIGIIFLFTTALLLIEILKGVYKILLSTREKHSERNSAIEETYENFIDAVSTFIAFRKCIKEGSNANKEAELTAEIFKITHRIQSFYLSSELDEEVDYFISHPDLGNAESLIEVVKKIRNTKKISFFKKCSNHFNSSFKKKQLPIDPDVRNISIKINDDFRRDELIQGIEIPEQLSIKFKLSEMTDSQRKKLTELFFKTYRRIPDNFQLSLISYDKHHNRFSQKQWEAKLNPNTTKPQEILKSWENDFSASYESAQKSLESQNSSSVL